MELTPNIVAWLSGNESFLSGLAALIVIIGFIGTMLRSFNSAPKESGEAANSRLTLKNLTAPSPFPIELANVDGLNIAFNVQGHGKHNLLVTPGIISNLHISANLPPIADTMESLAKFSKLVNFDKRGQGLSDPTPNVATLSQRIRDIEAVADAASFDKFFLMGISEGGPMSIQFAHENPTKVKGLILFGTTAKFLRDDDYSIGLSEKALDALVQNWGTAITRDIFFPSITEDEMDTTTYKGFEKLLADKKSMSQIVEYMKTLDVRKILKSISCPSLVVHFTGDLAVPIRMGRNLSRELPNSEFVEVAGVDHCDLAKAPNAIEAIQNFMIRNH